MEMNIWYAVSKSGQGCVFVTQPERNDHRGIWEGTLMGCVTSLVMTMESEGFELPRIKWNDDPVRFTLKLSRYENE